MENTDLQWFIWGNCNSHIKRAIQEENTGYSHVLHQVGKTQKPTCGTEGPSQLFQAVFSKCEGVGQADPPLFPLWLLPSFPFKHSTSYQKGSLLFTRLPTGQTRGGEESLWMDQKRHKLLCRCCRAGVHIPHIPKIAGLKPASLKWN